MRDTCGSCGMKSEQGGCKFFEGAEKPPRPYADQECLFIKIEGKSRWEKKPDPKVGKVVQGYDHLINNAPRDGAVFSPTPTHENPLSLVVAGRRKFLVDEAGNAFSNCEQRKPLGKAEDLKKEIEAQETKNWIDEKLKEKPEW